MGVLNDYECEAHGHFEAFERRCPHGCSHKFVKLVFLQPVGTRSAKTAYVDRELKQMAKDYNLPDIRNDKDGTSTMTKLGRDGKGTSWMDIPHAKPGFSREGGKVPTVDIKQFGADPGASPGFAPGRFGAPTPNFVGRPRPE